MPRYQYRHMLHKEGQSYPYPELDETGRHILAEAFALAKETHRGVSRQKIDSGVRYISHPIMVCDILYRMGERDPKLLAAALLHDTMEEKSGSYYYDAKQFLANLTLVLNRRFSGIDRGPSSVREMSADEIASIAAEIVQLCEQVTNPAKRSNEGNEVEQADRALGMGLAAKKLKIADQAASLICNLTMANDPKHFSINRERGFLEKAQGLVVSIIQSAKPEEVEALKPWDYFFARTVLCAHHLFPFSQAAGETDEAYQTRVDAHRVPVREEFDFDHLMDSNTKISVVPKRSGIYEHLFIGGAAVERDSTRHPHGLARVDSDGLGNVVSYVIWAQPGVDAAGEVNAVQGRLANALREKRRMAFGSNVEEEPAQRGIVQMDERMQAFDEQDVPVGTGRLYYLEPSLPAMAFAAAVRQANACSKEWSLAIESVAKQIQDKRLEEPLLQRNVEAPGAVVEAEKPSAGGSRLVWITDGKRLPRPRARGKF